MVLDMKVDSSNNIYNNIKINFTKKDKIINYQNGDVYIGEWANNLFHGKGFYIFQNGERYEGDLVNGSKTGIGIYSYFNGNIYQGEFLNDKKVKININFPAWTWQDGLLARE